jgi:predicted DNA-binding transcriptional regulator AlpA
MIAKKFKQRGWRLGKRVELDVCEVCITKEKISRKSIKLGDLSVSDVKVLGLGAVPPPLPAEERTLTIIEAVRLGWASKPTIYKYISDGKLPCIKEDGKMLRVKEIELERAFKDMRKPTVKAEPRPILHLKMTRPIREPSPTVNDPQPVLNEGDATVSVYPQPTAIMTKEDRRIIFSEIDSHYLDELRGYAKDWDDEKVATGLKVPTEWVRSIREDNFGAEKGDQIGVEVEKLKVASAEAEALIKTMRELWDAMDRTLLEYETKQAALSGEATKIHAALADAKGKIDIYTSK